MDISHNYALICAGIYLLIIWAVNEQNTYAIGACFYSISRRLSSEASVTSR
jgi:hypothetical protein